jgi:hypothetical protein
MPKKEYLSQINAKCGITSILGWEFDIKEIWSFQYWSFAMNYLSEWLKMEI